MKVYILTREPIPIGMAATNRIIHYAKALISNGVECEIIVTRRTEVYGNVRNRSAKGIIDNMIPFRYITNKTERSSKFINRRIHDFIDDWIVPFWIKRNVKRNDCIIYFNPTYKCARAITRKCKNNGISIVRELCEFPYGTRNDSLKNRIMLKSYEKLVMPHFDGFIAISQALEEYAHQISAKDAKIIRVPILIDKEQYNAIIAYAHNKPYIFHAGTMYERKDAIVSTMKAFAIANKELNGSVDFILAGPESPHRAELHAIIEEYGLHDNVHFIGRIEHSDVLKYQKGAWLSILNKHDNIQNRCGFSTKLGDVLLAGTPVITTPVGEANNFIIDGQSALIAKSSSPKDIAEQIIRAFRSPELLAEISKNCEVVAKNNFDYRIQGARLKEYFESFKRD